MKHRIPLKLLLVAFPLFALSALAGCIETRLTSRSSGDSETASDDQSVSTADENTGSGSDSPTDSIPEENTGSGSATVDGTGTSSEDETTSPLGSDTQSDSGLPPDDTDAENPEIGVDCDDANPCQDELECFAGACMDDLGSFEWGKERDDVATAMAIDGDDNIYVAGSRREANPLAEDPNDPGFQIAYVTKFRPDGTPQWSKEFGSTGANKFVYDMAVDGLDNIYVVGESPENLDGTIPAGNYRSFMFIAKYDSAGNRQWIKQSTMVGLTSSGSLRERSNKAKAVAIDANGEPWVAGTIVNNKIFFVKFSQDNGEQGAVTELCQNDTYSFGNDILIDPSDNGKYVLGMDDGNAVLYKFDQAGAQQWRQEWKTTNDLDDAPQSMAFGQDGSIYAVGHSAVDDGGTDIFVAKIDPSTSNLKWITFLEQFASSDTGLDIAAHPDGGMYITGSVGADITLIRFSAQHEWQLAARPSNPEGPDLIIGNSYGMAPDESGLPVGESGDFFYDSSELPPSGIEHGLYNKHGSDWVLVACETVVSGLPRLTLGAGA
ncbi:MAG: SBBP repeat-containing protein, partial [Myxococcota bacterium]|nr:SBBP repeat-containing protein [Myxococcota bacterium]